MEQAAIWRRMAEKWREAAEEAAAPALRRCYAERAASYERLTGKTNPSDAQPRRCAIIEEEHHK